MNRYKKTTVGPSNMPIKVKIQYFDTPVLRHPNSIRISFIRSPSEAAEMLAQTVALSARVSHLSWCGR